MPQGKSNNPEGKNQWTGRAKSLVSVPGLAVKQGFLNANEAIARARAKAPIALRDKIQTRISEARLDLAVHKDALDKLKASTSSQLLKELMPANLPRTLKADSKEKVKTVAEVIREGEVFNRYKSGVIEAANRSYDARTAYKKAAQADDRLALASIKAAANKDKLKAALKGK